MRNNVAVLCNLPVIVSYPVLFKKYSSAIYLKTGKNVVTNAIFNKKDQLARRRRDKDKL